MSEPKIRLSQISPSATGTDSISGNVTISNDLTVGGNLVVSGNTTTLNVETLLIEDNELILNSNVASTPTLNAQITVNRGSSSNTFLLWDESADKWGWSDDGNNVTQFANALLKTGDTMTGELNVANNLVITGNVGIGTANPGARLGVYGTGTANDPCLALDITTSSSFVHAQESFANNITTGQSVISVIGKEGSGYNSGYVGYLYSGTPGSNDNKLTFGHWNANHLMTLDGVGNVAIGTTSTIAAFEVYRSTSGGPFIALNNAAAGGNNYYWFSHGTSNDIPGGMGFYNASAAAYRLIINSAGNVGIGTITIPFQTKLDVFETGGSTNWRARIVSRNDTGDRASFLGVYNGNAGVFAHNNALNDWADLYVNTINASSVVNSGNVYMGAYVGIGTSSVSMFTNNTYPQRLYIKGTIPGSYWGMVTFEVDNNTGDVNHGIINLYNSKTTAVGDDARIMFTFKEGDGTPHPLASMGGVKEGSFQGAIQFNTRSASGSFSEKMRINCNGHVTVPNVPSFRAGRSGNYSPGTNADIVFNDTSGYNHNNGSHYNTSNGRFTAPVAGRYYFSACVIWGPGIADGQEMDDACYIYVNGNLAAYSLKRAEYVAGTTGNSGYYVDHVNSVLSLNAGDYVTIRNQRNLLVHGNTNYCWFSGFLIG